MLLHRIVVLLLVLMSLLAGCKSKPVTAPAGPDYSRPLPPGTFGLRRVTDPMRMPDLAPAAAQLRDPAFQEALERSLRWFGYASSPQYFPLGPISHPHAHTSVYAMRTIAQQGGDTSACFSALQADFDVWESVGWDGSGTVLFTGYYTPIFQASRTKSPAFPFPIYRRPADLQSDPSTGEVIGSYPSRAELESSGVLNGLELVYLPSRLDAYIIEVNGSAKLQMIDGSTMYVGFAGTNGHEYTSIGKLLVANGALDANRVSLPTIREHFRTHPTELDGYIRQNSRFVFFREYPGDNWPAGSMGFKVTPMRSLATDKAIFPRGLPVLVNTTIPVAGAAATRPFNQLMVDQDTGGAIRAAGRGDIYIGIGSEAESLAGRQAAEGRMYYLLLKPERVQEWYDRMQANPPRSAAR